MTTNHTTLRIRTVIKSAAHRIACQIRSVKQAVFAEFAAALGANDQLLRLALSEAEAIANQTDFPHLLFPVLANEKAQQAARWQFRQQHLMRNHYVLAT